MKHPALDHPVFTELDRQFGQFIARFSQPPAGELALGAALLSHQCRLGHACLDLNALNNLSSLASRHFPDPERRRNATLHPTPSYRESSRHRCNR